IKGLRSRAFVLIPLVVQGRAIGVLGADRMHSRRPLDAATLELLQLFAVLAALAIEQARLYEERRMAAIQLDARVEDRTRELQAANVHLEAASRHKSAFLANMSHELRTPLNGILGFSDLLQDPTFGPLNEKQARYLGHIHTSGKHLLALINDLLDLSRVEAGKIELRPETFVLHEALTAALTEIRLQAEAKQLQLELQVDPALTTLTADPVRLKQIVLNLLSNAVKFTPEGGAVTVSAASLTSGWIEIAVQDTGIGIKAEDLSKLFQPFTQLESPVTMRNQGTGLGLALTKHLVELHGGQIAAASDGEGRGSTFTVCLPLSPQVGSGVMG
ncbi:GAF domain-containing sensor histidine kinase, partial [Candidatus Methylomirabilis sp.]|uniref:GAF domain-containing sensor histidine kinase n=1 Tax=Candidatus Methylomirabilis sp. TaxID=2032687 RepID=UPI003C733CEC